MKSFVLYTISPLYQSWSKVIVILDSRRLLNKFLTFDQPCLVLMGLVEILGQIQIFNQNYG
ncbi:hypothetical protein BpHYR1_032747 [Brachionus plicatilis]|uniref:Uncharacterized protein n=1 Tax=Brachionus plicatilis TaxID=10195 RepID=A0A3M7QZ42_BRAPC|nr:hypothetical protein BpHYR1_032747 [Brachionus plicatilis]